MKMKISFDVDVDIHYVKGGGDACRMGDYDKERLKEEICSSINGGMPSLLIDATDSFGRPADAIAEFKNIRNVDITLE